jgi:hypothetical protein
LKLKKTEKKQNKKKSKKIKNRNLKKTTKISKKWRGTVALNTGKTRKKVVQK